jgi:putative Mg2+ transporter-C (MgtC) family protein
LNSNTTICVGFLGAGIIYRNSSAGTSHGLTTAATVWCTAAVGVAVGLNMFIIAIVGAIALYFLLSLHHQHWYIEWKKKMINKHNEKDNAD